jgi:hypothetical protein
LKGQNLAVETILVFGLGLIVAIGVIGIFHQYRMGVMENAEPEQVEMVSSRVLLAMESLREIDDKKNGTGSYNLDLPDRIAGNQYTLSLGENITVSVRGKSYETRIVGLNGYDMSGRVSGGDITVFKDENKYELRAN